MKKAIVPKFFAEDYLSWLIFAAAAYLVLTNLDYAALWHDESPNAVIAANFSQTGTLTGWNGRNLFVGANGVALNSNLQAVSYPPWPIVASALGLIAFGDGEFALRFPHALLGLLSLFFFWRLLRMDFSPHPRLCLAAFALFALSAQTILYMRQGRYYADAFCFSLAAFYCYRVYLQNSRARWLAAAAVLTALNFLNHFAIGVSSALAIAAWHLLFYFRHTSRRQWFSFAVAGAATAAVCLAYLTAAGIVGGDEQLEYSADIYPESWWARRPVLLYRYFRDIVYLGWLPLWPALWAAGFCIHHLYRRAQRRAKNRKKSARKRGVRTAPHDKNDAIMRWAMMAVLQVFFAAMVSVQPVHTTSVADMRYLLAAAPFLALCLALCVEAAWARQKAAGAMLLLLLLLTNFAGLPYYFEGVFRRSKTVFPLPMLVREIHRSYPTAISEVAAFLREHAEQDDTFYHPAWADSSVLQYYLDDKLIFCCALDEQAKIPKDKVRALGIPAYRGDTVPDWIVQPAGDNPDASQYEKVYETKSFAYPTQRPEIEFRSFTPILASPETAMVIYRRRDKQ